MSDRIRLDQALEARGLLPSRARARDAILRGTVTVNGVVASKPNQQVAADDSITLDDPAARYVSRAALKLVAGLEVGGIEPAGRVCLDLGASTGGFTQVLLERGAARVYAVDVGHDQLHERVKADPRVVSLEGVNGRDLTVELIREPIGLLVCDISFVSVLKVLEVPLSLCAAKAEAVILIKPQFEVGRDNVGKGGIVTDEGAIVGSIADVVAFLIARGWTHLVSVPSPIAGGDGNHETVAVFQLSRA
ncbi:hemolysin [Devosia sp. Root413D1]|uniref:TlyA family RNA methyltransferase n=1 Tax=unclassified Devosia TaxID=196773 RepID=UPI000701006E|nr:MULTISPECIES: TlyA family RNA methyltransferase [unclassified Devosia]KQV09094.1 hemolysin [Devosia sp. Root105]KQW86075.1 hemolysin [Devosia sp. Root413D1]